MRYELLYLDSVPLRSPDEGNAGYDLPLYGDIIIEPGALAAVKVGLAVEIPDNHVGIVFGRSGNAFKRKLLVIHNGVIDASYRGDIGVLLYNLGSAPIKITSGEFIAQLVIFPVYASAAEESPSLTQTERGSKGFGSTGLAGELVKEINSALGIPKDEVYGDPHRSV
jgi:dUTP pyrophosphatase